MFFPVSGIECHPLVPVLAAMGISFVTSMGGLSGAFLLLPFQMSFLGYTSPGVSATNHLFNVLACPGGIVRYAREGRLLWPLALTVAVGTLPGIVLGSLIRVYWLPDESRFKVFAGLLLLWIFWRMFRDLRRPAAPARKGGGMARIHVERWDRSRLVFTFGEARHSVSCPRLAALSLGIGLAGGSVVHTRQYFVEVDELMFLDAVIRSADDEVGTPDDIIQFFHSNLCQILAYFAGKEGKVVHKVFATADETFAQFRVLGGYTYGTCVLVTLAHHHASQYDEGSGGETVFFRTEHGHEYYVASGFQLSVGLQNYLTTKSVQNQCLLCLAQSQFR